MKYAKVIKIFAFVSALALLLIPAACTTGSNTQTTTTGPAVQGPVISITSPSFNFDPAHPGERPVIAGPTSITITVDVSGFNLVPEGQTGQAPYGHIIYYRDVVPLISTGQPALTDPGTYVSTIAKSHTWQNVPTGPHIFYVMLVNSDNTPLSVPAFDNVMVIVEGAPVSIGQPTSAPGADLAIITPTFDFDPAHPGERPVVNGPDITIGVQVTGFNLVQAGQTGQAPYGHLVYYLDAIPPTTVGQSALTSAGTFVSTTSLTNTWKNISQGPHVFWVQLVNTDNTPLTPAIMVNITLIVINP
ncbi:hypothetical protein [Dehalogenimonas etheniformans]|uniref:DUF4399 domain-containing protein n=1 Tax=Dehalogenimonas etheniformans TaxID=1536648 RepID=A0A2P5PAA0_9CHLR|nr:hypothetical protein [Dehalogenimonas etheniformans]PPD59204.1 hypothetical protein JP09_000570 [Dehalogenimonas etheniformans]QNT75753.1 hypothetical protein HX448_03150 [Dehalogenimonas etheniformans]